MTPVPPFCFMLSLFLERLDALIATATATFAETLDESERATAILHLQRSRGCRPGIGTSCRRTSQSVSSSTSVCGCGTWLAPPQRRWMMEKRSHTWSRAKPAFAALNCNTSSQDCMTEPTSGNPRRPCKTREHGMK